MKVILFSLIILVGLVNATDTETKPRIVNREDLQFIFSYKLIINTKIFKDRDTLYFCFFGADFLNNTENYKDNTTISLNETDIYIRVIRFATDSYKCDAYFVTKDYKEKNDEIKSKREDNNYIIFNFNETPQLNGADVSIYVDNTSRLKYFISDRLEYESLIVDLAQNVPYSKTTMYAHTEKNRIVK